MTPVDPQPADLQSAELQTSDSHPTEAPGAGAAQDEGLTAVQDRQTEAAGENAATGASEPTKPSGKTGFLRRLRQRLTVAVPSREDDSEVEAPEMARPETEIKPEIAQPKAEIKPEIAQSKAEVKSEAEESAPASTEAKAKPKAGLKHRPTQLLIVGAIATFALGGAASYLLRRPTNGPSALQPGTALVPNSAVASLTLNPQSEPWQALRQLGTPSFQRGLGDWLAVGRDRVINLGYGDLDAIQQQLSGPAVMALVPVSRPAAPAPVQPGQRPQANPSDLLLVAPLKNPQAVARSLDERQPPEGFENNTDSHRGIKIWDLQVDLTQRQTVAIFGDFGLLASNRSTIEQAIDSYQAGTALANLNDYEDAQRRLEATDLGAADGALMSFYINGPAAVLSNQAAGRLLPLPTELQGLVSHVRITDDDELTLNTVTWDQAADGLGVLGQPATDLGERPEAMVALGDRFPASTSFLLSGSSVQEAWRSFSQGPASGNSLLSPSTLQEQVQAVTSMDLQQDWLSWMDGPYSVGILPIPTQANSRFQTGLTVMAQTSNRRLAERSLQKLDALMVNKYGLTLSTSELDGQPVVNWSNRDGEAVVTHGWLEGNIAFLIVGAPGANLLLPQPRATLAASRLYREGMPRAATQSPAGVLFVDVDRVLDTQLPSLLPLTPGSRPVLEELKSIGVERRPLDERFSRYDLSLKLLDRAAAPPAVISPDAASPDITAPDAAPSDAAPSETTEPAVDTSPDVPESPEPRLTEPLSPEPLAPPITPEPSAESETQESSRPALALPEPAPFGPTFPEGATEFGPQLPTRADSASPDSTGPNSASFENEVEGDRTIPERPPSNRISVDESEEESNRVDLTETESETLPDGSQEESSLESSLEQSPSALREDIIVNPNPPVPIGPPTPPRNFDFAPIGPKLPAPEAQQWSDSFTEPAGE